MTSKSNFWHICHWKITIFHDSWIICHFGKAAPKLPKKISFFFHRKKSVDCHFVDFSENFLLIIFLNPDQTDLSSWKCLSVSLYSLIHPTNKYLLSAYHVIKHCSGYREYCGWRAGYREHCGWKDPEYATVI